jgi:hypothetical protein
MIPILWTVSIATLVSLVANATTAYLYFSGSAIDPLLLIASLVMALPGTWFVLYALYDYVSYEIMCKKRTEEGRRRFEEGMQKSRFV